MAQKLTKQTKAKLAKALANMSRAHGYIHSDGIAVCRRGLVATTTLHYSRADGTTLYEVERAAGSELCLLETAMTIIRNVIDPPQMTA